ncbi:MAG: DUF924 domain-containing protein [Gammaproteobacteria bacterium]|nr:DUF924 domain-containing protein [Gammaproteobacteria bacterium]
MTHQEILTFWFQEITPKDWWVKSDRLDQEIKTRFLCVHQAACNDELCDWRTSPESRLAEVIILDQFSRNIYRGQPEAFENDALALTLAQEAIFNRCDQDLAPTQRAFLYMPFMHSESPFVHVQAERLFKQDGMEGNYEAELKHKAIIDRFGRYPHRNASLGRESTPEENAFLLEPDSSF